MKFSELNNGDQFRISVNGRYDRFPVLTKNGCLACTSDGYCYRIDDDRDVLIQPGIWTEPVVCGMCGSQKPIGQSCDCFDNHCQ